MKNPMQKKMRMDFLRDFDYYVRNVIGDDDITYDVWCSTGVPDGWNEDDLESIAEDDELWVDCCKTFEKCLKMADVKF